MAIAELDLLNDTSQETRLTLVSWYGTWERAPGGKPIFADASVHRLLSDIAPLVCSSAGHRIIAAGDLNIMRGYGENGSRYWGARYDSVFRRAMGMGIPYVGPELPHGEAAAVRPAELPTDSTTVPTYRVRFKNPETATRQLDFVFASQPLHERLSTFALNSKESWGPSDHCRLVIDLLKSDA